MGLAERLLGVLRHPAAALAPEEAAARAFGLSSSEELRSLFSCLLLCEAVYKPSPDSVVAALNDLAPRLPVAHDLHEVEIATSGGYLLARGTGTLYVCFRGTLGLRDYLTDANFLLRELWQAEAAVHTTTTSFAPAAHRGFLGRAEGVPAEALHMHALRHCLRLVLCGHSLGGAVAALCTLRLLAALGQGGAASTQLRCVTFGSPPLGNAALATHVRERQWETLFHSYVLPEDPIPRLFLGQAQPGPARDAAAAAALETLFEQEGAGSSEEVREAAPLSSSGGTLMGAWLVGRLRSAVPGVAAAASSALARTRGSTPASQRAQPAFEGAVGELTSASSSGGQQQAADLPPPPAVAAPPSALRLPGAAASWAAGRMQAMGASARSWAPSSALPAFVHFGSRRYLRLPAQPEGQHSSAYAPPLADAGRQLLALSQPARLHSLAAYRRRAVRIASTALQRAGDSAVPPVAASSVRLAAIAPVPEVAQAVARVPPLFPPPTAATGPSTSPAAGHTVLAMEVRGRGLEFVTGALLQLPESDVLEALAVANHAREALVQQLASLAARASGAGSSGRWLRSPMATIEGRLSLEFAAPMAALLAMQLLPGTHNPTATLVLLSDFKERACTADLACKAVWLAGDAGLSSAAFHSLVRSGQELAMPQPQPATAPWQRWPGPLTSLPGSLSTAADSALPWLRGRAPRALEVLQHSTSEQQRQRQQGKGPWWRAALRPLHQLWGSLQLGQEPRLPEALSFGVVLTDASGLVAGMSSMAQCVELAADVVRWQASPHVIAGSLEDGSADGMGDEDLALHADLKLGARLRRHMHEAGSAARRLQRWLQRWPHLRARRPPSLLVLVLRLEALHLTGTDPAPLNAQLLSALRALATACQAASLGLLLAVVARQPPSRAYRENLALSVGLAAGSAAVVPLAAGPPGTEHADFDVRLLHAAIGSALEAQTQRSRL